MVWGRVEVVLRSYKEDGILGSVIITTKITVLLLLRSLLVQIWHFLLSIVAN